MSTKSPAFQFYPDDFMGGKPALMTHEEIGLYVMLLCLDWNQNGFVFDEKRLAHFTRTTPAQFKKLWRTVGECFDQRDGRMFNSRLDLERAKQAEFSDRQRAKAMQRWSPSNAPAMPRECSPSPSPITKGSSGKSGQTEGAKKPRPSYPWMGEIRGVLKRVYGKEPKGKFYANILAPLVDQHGIEMVCVELEAYLRQTPKGFINMTKFAAMFGTWGTPEPEQPAARIWSEIQRTGILHDLTTADWQRHITEIVETGAVESRERLEEIWRAANIALLRSTKNERQAIEHLAEVMTRKAA